jgi:predicted aspartyl protease
MRKSVRVERMEIAGVVFSDIEATVDPRPDAPAANVGVSLLRRFDRLSRRQAVA